MKASAEGHVSEYTGRSLSVEMQRHLLGDSVIGPLGELTGDVYELLEDAKKSNDNKSAAILSYIHERICRARHEISGDETRPLPPRPKL